MITPTSLWKFSRPHTIIGTTLSVISVALIALWSTHHNLLNINQILTNISVVLIACLNGNIYIVGLNQLSDIPIDQINKPTLPIASGEITPINAKRIITITGLIALLLSWLAGLYLFATVATSLVIGTIYSLPPIRLKRYPFWAAFCIFTVRGVIVNLGLFLHYTAIWSSPQINPPILVLTLFIIIFTIAIAIFKDIPDLEGDQKYEIQTLTIQLGKETVFKLALWIITIAYLTTIITSLSINKLFHPIYITSTHLILLTTMWIYSTKIDLTNRTQITQYYQFIWKLFFLEYLLYPIAYYF